MPRILTYDDFIKDLYSKSSYYRDGVYIVKGEYKNLNTKILVEDKYGECLMSPIDLMKNNKPSARSALNPTEYFINKAVDIHGHKYDYSDVQYKRGTDKVKIICSKHGSFLQAPAQHLSGQGCTKCGCELQVSKRTDDTKSFIEKAMSIHGDRYNYDLVEYVNSGLKVIITCKLHGNFSTIPDNHLSKKTGCAKCGIDARRQSNSEYCTGWGILSWEKAATRSKNFDSYKVYIIKCTDFNSGETFYKVGRTFLRIVGRFYNNTGRMPYNFSVARVIYFNNARDAFYKEVSIKRIVKKFKYKPSKEFKGNTECFKL